MSGWRTVELGDELTFQRGFDITKAEQIPGEVPVVSSGGVSSYHNEARLPGPGVVIGRKGTLGTVFYFDSGYWPHDTTLWVKDFKGNDPKFVYYFMKEHSVAHLDVGSANPTLNRNHLHLDSVSWAPVSEQRAIAATLGAFDDKIESNHRVSDVALKLAAAGLSTGNERVRVGDVATVAKGLSYKGAGLDDGSSHDARPMLNLGSFTKKGALNWSGIKHYTGDFKPKHELIPWDLVIANTDLTQAREFIGRGVLVPEALAGALHTHHTTRVSFTDRPDLALVLWAQAETPEFRARAMGFASGTTVASLPAEAVLDFEMMLPSDLENAIVRARRLIEMAWQKHAESSRLAMLRDMLLPELLSGRVRAPVADDA